MPAVTEEELKKHLNNIVDAFYALSPTRNYVLQLLEILPEDYVTLVDAYPELFKDEETRQRLKDILGIAIGEKVEPGSGLGYKCKFISDRIRSDFFGSYGWEELRTKLGEYLGRELPNVNEELWEHKIRIAMSEPTYGDDVKKVLTSMVKEGEGGQLQINLSQMTEKTALDRSRLLEIKRFLAQKLSILETAEEIFSLDRRLSEYKDLLSKYFGEKET